MTSTTAAGQPEVPDEIKALFSWNPPRLCPAPKTKSSTKSSTATRSPAFYGKHFSSDLVVKKVVRLPSLVRDLAGNVDRVLDALETIPPLEGFFKFRAEQREDSNDAGFIKGCATAKYCSRVASTLALHPSFPQWRSLLFWTQSGPSSDYTRMGGQLLFLEEGVDQDKTERSAIVESMDSK